MSALDRDPTATTTSADADAATVHLGEAQAEASDGTPTAIQWAWDRYRLYDQNAIRLRREFLRLEMTILAVGLGTTLLALLQNAVVTHHLLHANSIAARTIHTLVIVLPITLAALLGMAARFRVGNKWVDLRKAAEGIKREVFLYRVRSGLYGHTSASRLTRDELLAQNVAAIGRGVMQTEVSRMALRDPPPGDATHPALAEGDDGVSDMGPADYVRYRVDDQIDYYAHQVEVRGRLLRWLLSLIFIAGGVGTLLAALNVDVWIAMTTAVVGAVTTFLGYEQVESLLVSYNQAMNGLVSVKGWWVALPPHDRESKATKERLVHQTERILQKEQGGWVEDMTEALDQLREEEEKESKGDADT
jgi:hypothetical protein